MSLDPEQAVELRAWALDATGWKAPGARWWAGKTLTVLDALDEAQATIAGLKEGVTVYVHLASTGEGCPTGTWQGDEQPPLTVHVLGDPDAVRAVRAWAAAKTEAEALVAEARSVLTHADSLLGLARYRGEGRADPEWCADVDALIPRLRAILARPELPDTTERIEP